MLRILFALTLAMICCAVAAAQQPNPQCPTISVTGPDSVLRPGQTAIYTATISDSTLKSYSFEWQVSVGNIVSGFSDPTIRIQLPGDQDSFKAVATVTVNGLPSGCLNRVSETTFVSSGWHPAAIDEFGRLPRNDEKARLAYASDQLVTNPNMILFLVVRVPKKLGRAAHNARVKTITTLFNSLRVSKDKYVFVDAGDGELSTTIYLMPPSAAPDSWKTGKYR